MEPTNLAAISSILDQAGITVEQATSDADTYVSTSLELADSGKAVVLVGTDADFLVMLVARTPPDAKLFLLRPSMNAKPAKVFNISVIQLAVRDRKQVQQWLGRDLPPTDWGLKYHNNSLIPIATDLPATHQKLMKVILKLQL